MFRVQGLECGGFRQCVPYCNSRNPIPPIGIRARVLVSGFVVLGFGMAWGFRALWVESLLACSLVLRGLGQQDAMPFFPCACGAHKPANHLKISTP